MQDTSTKCADRVASELKDREDQIGELTARGFGGDEDSLQKLYDLPLSIETVQETTITLSWGGPADYLHIKHNAGEILGLTYRFSDWYDTATVELDETSPLWDYASDLIETLNA